MPHAQDKFRNFVAFNANPVAQARQDACTRVGTNFYGRLESISKRIECGQDGEARRELLDLLRFFPKRSNPA